VGEFAIRRCQANGLRIIQAEISKDPVAVNGVFRPRRSHENVSVRPSPVLLHVACATRSGVPVADDLKIGFAAIAAVISLVFEKMQLKDPAEKTLACSAVSSA
jgi:hypothetical protein